MVGPSRTYHHDTGDALQRLRADRGAVRAPSACAAGRSTRALERT